jgi:hypothetical protein
VAEDRAELPRTLDTAGIQPIVLDEAAAKLGAVETWQDSQKCADLLWANRDRIDGILVVVRLLPLWELGPEPAAEARIGSSPIHESLGLANTFGAIQRRAPAGPSRSLVSRRTTSMAESAPMSVRAVSRMIRSTHLGQPQSSGFRACRTTFCTPASRGSSTTPQ